MFRRNAFLLALPLVLTYTPAHAADPELRVGYVVQVIPEGDQSFVVTICYAIVEPSDSSPADVPVATTVRCAVDGHGASMLTPGPASTVATTTADAPDLTICYSASALIQSYPVDGPPRTYTVDVAERCEAT